MTPNPFLDADRRLRSGWWIGIFFAVLAGLLLPLILLARGSGAPEVLWVRDQSNVPAVNYSSTEIMITLRWDL